MNWVYYGIGYILLFAYAIYTLMNWYAGKEQAYFKCIVIMLIICVLLLYFIRLQVVYM